MTISARTAAYREKFKSNRQAALWIAALFGAVSLPFLTLLIGQSAEGGGPLWDFSKGLGFSALAMVGLQFALTARFRRLSHPFGIDIVYLFHRYVAIGATLLALAHFGILYIWFEPALGELNPLNARWELTAGRVAITCFVFLVISSEFRKRLHLDYAAWRYLHVALGVIGFCAAVAHVLGVGHFTATLQNRMLWAGVTVAWLGLIVWVRLIKPWHQTRNPWRVVHVAEERGGAATLTLRPERAGLSSWKPGQFAWLTLGRSPFRLSEHPFTISSSPNAAPSLAVTIKPLGDFSAKAIDVEPGTRAYIDGPYGVFSIDDAPEAEGFVMVAGGIGVTPMIANLRAMNERGDERPVVFFYANPTWDDAAFRDELETLEKTMNLRVVHVVEEAPDGWTGEHGMLRREIIEKHARDNTRLWPHLLCGPSPMTTAVKSALRELGVPASRIDSEIFDMV